MRAFLPGIDFAASTFFPLDLYFNFMMKTRERPQGCRPRIAREARPNSSRSSGVLLFFLRSSRARRGAALAKSATPSERRNCVARSLHNCDRVFITLSRRVIENAAKGIDLRFIRRIIDPRVSATPPREEMQKRAGDSCRVCDVARGNHASSSSRMLSGSQSETSLKPRRDRV